MTAEFTLGVPADVQQSSYQNATLQSDEGGHVAYSIATYVDVPADVALRGEQAVRDYLRMALHTPEMVRFDVVIGPEDKEL